MQLDWAFADLIKKKKKKKKALFIDNSSIKSNKKHLTFLDIYVVFLWI